MKDVTTAIRLIVRQELKAAGFQPAPSPAPELDTLPETVYGYPALFAILRDLGFSGFSQEAIRAAGRAGRIAGITSEGKRNGKVTIHVREALDSLGKTKMI